MYKKICDAIEKGHNLFITGAGGTGKSYMLNKLRKKYNIELTSTTGLSAMNIGGSTIHSWAGIGIANRSIDIICKHIKEKRQNVYQKIINTDILAIDEISMLDNYLFNYIENVFTILRKINKPFGGMQIICIGDFFQLPPVELEKGYAFESKAWQDAEFINFNLEKIYRQNDINFITALNNARLNKMTDNDIQLFESRNTLDYSKISNTLHLFTKNKPANNHNIQKLNELDGVLCEYNSIDNGIPENIEILEKNCIAPKKLLLKEGAKIIFIKNDNILDVYNGQSGIITELRQHSIKVKTKNGNIKNVAQVNFDYEHNGNVVASRKQFPIRLAWGLTIHKSQGMTLDEVAINLSSAFACGQSYVALSRAKTLEGLYLFGFKKDCIFCDPKVINFYENMPTLPKKIKLKYAMSLSEYLENQNDFPLIKKPIPIVPFVDNSEEYQFRDVGNY